jgi:hypothetical protein
MSSVCVERFRGFPNGWWQRFPGFQVPVAWPGFASVGGFRLELEG